MKKRYDLIVLGSSLESLLSVAYASYLGLNVLVIEEQKEIGGINKTISKNKFSFDLTTPFFTNLGTQDNPGLLLKILNELNITVDYKIDSNILTYILDKQSEIRKVIQTIPYDNRNILNNIENIAPGSRTKLKEMIIIANEYYQIYEQAFYLNFENFSMSQLNKNYHKAYKYFDYTVQDLYNDLKVNPELRRILSAFMLSFGEFNEELPAWWFLVKLYEVINFGIATLTNKTQDLVEKLFMFAINKGTDILLDTEIKKIIVSNNQIQAVETSRGTFLTNQIISSYQDNYVLAHLIGKDIVPKFQLQNTLVKKNNSQTLFFNLGLRTNLAKTNLKSYLTYIYNDDDYKNIDENISKEAIIINNALIKCLNFVNPELNEKGMVILNIEVIYNGNFFLNRPIEMIYLDENYIQNMMINFVSKAIGYNLFENLDASYILSPIKIAKYTKNKSGIFLGKKIFTYNPIFLSLKNQLSKENIQGLHFATQDGIFGFTTSNALLTSIFETKLVNLELESNKNKLKEIIEEQKEIFEIKKQKLQLPSTNEQKSLENFEDSSSINENEEIKISKPIKLKKGESLLKMENKDALDLQIFDYFAKDDLKENIVIEEDVVNTEVIEEIRETDNALKEEAKLLKAKKNKNKKVKKQRKFHIFLKGITEFEKKYASKDWYLIDAAKISFNTIVKFASKILDHKIEPNLILHENSKIIKSTKENDIALVIINSSKIIFPQKYKLRIPRTKHQLHLAKLRAKKSDLLIYHAILSIVLNHKYRENVAILDNIHVYKNSKHQFKMFSPKLLKVPKRNISKQKLNDFVYIIYPPRNSMDDLEEKTKLLNNKKKKISKKMIVNNKITTIKNKKNNYKTKNIKFDNVNDYSEQFEKDYKKNIEEKNK
ncbi:MAG: hypothetical protein ACTTJO_01465 [Metamycoplasmataceae bacterium]